jgi:hypothetical protein
MQRTSIVHYIDPSCISVTPNANGSADDLAVYVAKDTKIRVYSPRAGIGMEDNIYREWTLSGRNRRLAESNKPYTIYARLPKEDANNGYLVFAPKTEHNSQWVDKYSSVTPDGESVLYTESGVDVRVTSDDVWYVRLGDVSLPVDGKREVDLDTGTLGTEQFNNEWALNPDVSPLSVALSAAINSQDAGPAPYVYWGQTLLLTARLVEGWTGTNIQRFDHWEIVRNSGDANADAIWNAVDRSSTFGELGVIYLNHNRGNGSTDDFNGSVNTTFIVNAMENTGTEENPIYAVLKSASIDIMAETWETYGLSLSSDMITYNPMTQEYSPSDGVYVKIRATNQKSETSLLTNQQVSGAGLVVEYSTVGAATEVWTAISFSGESSAIAVARIPVSAFGQQSLNVRLRNSDDPEHNTGTELYRTTIAFLRDGEDSKEREWIFFRSSSAITFGNADSAHPKPALISGGEVNPTGAAGDSEPNKNQDGWVPYKWWDEQRGVTSTYRYEYGAYRDYVKDGDSSSSGEDSGGYWGPFTDPVLWNHYGKDGSDGSDGVSFEVRWSDSFGVIDNIACNSDGVPKYRRDDGYAPWLTATLYKREGNATPSAFQAPTIKMHAYLANGTEILTSGLWPRETTNASSLTLNNYDSVDTTYVRYIVEFLDPNNQVIASSSIARIFDGEDGEDGQDGPRGKMGRWIYYGGEFDENNNTDTFAVSDVQMPYFHTQSGYRAFDYGVNGSYTMAQMYGLQSNFDYAPWAVMTNEFKYLITQAIFSGIANLGSFVINGDWMISQTARSDSPSNDYTHFNPDYPDRQEPSATGLFNGDNFIPMYAVNGNAGTTYQNAGVIGGFNINNNGLAIGTYNPDTWFSNPTNFAFLNTSAFRIARTDMYNQYIDGAFVFMGQNCNPKDSDDDHDTAIYIYRRKVLYTLASELYKPAAQIISDNIAGINVALRLQGALQLHGGGVLSQGQYIEYADVNNRKILNPTKGTTFVLKNTNNSNVWFQFPTLADVYTMLGIASETTFAIPITISAHRSSNDFYLVAPANVKFYDNAGAALTPPLHMEKGYVVRFMLVFDGTEYYIQRAGLFD